MGRGYAEADPAGGRERGPGKVAGRLEAVGRVLGHRPGDDGVERRRQAGHEVARRRRVDGQVGEDLRDALVARERHSAGQQLVEHAAEGIYVAAAVDRRAANLLGGDVVERADEAAGRGHAAGAEVGHALGQSEVGQVEVLVGELAGDEHVRRLDVPVDEIAGVCGVEGGGDLADDPRRVRRIEPGVGAQEVAEVLTLDEAHHDVEQPVDVADLVDRDHVRVLDLGGERGLLLEPGAKIPVAGELGHDHLYGDRPIRAELTGLVDEAHPPAPGE